MKLISFTWQSYYFSILPQLNWNKPHPPPGIQSSKISVRRQSSFSLIFSNIDLIGKVWTEVSEANIKNLFSYPSEGLCRRAGMLAPPQSHNYLITQHWPDLTWYHKPFIFDPGNICFWLDLIVRTLPLSIYLVIILVK